MAGTKGFHYPTKDDDEYEVESETECDDNYEDGYGSKAKSVVTRIPEEWKSPRAQMMWKLKRPRSMMPGEWAWRPIAVSPFWVRYGPSSKAYRHKRRVRRVRRKMQAEKSPRPELLTAPFSLKLFKWSSD